MKDRAFNYQSIFRTLAIFFVLNSHLDGFYPSESFSSGGSLGNTMFFFISGLSLKNKFNITFINDLFRPDFLEQIIKRLKRIYLPIWFYLTFFLFVNLFIPKSFYSFDIELNLKNFYFNTGGTLSGGQLQVFF